MRVLPVGDDQWEIVGWLWQAFRADLSPVVNGLPYADGRFSHGLLDTFPAPGRVGHLAWAPHPNTGADAPVGFALVSGLAATRRSLDALWVAAPVRRTGAGRALARAVIEAYPGPWELAFQHDNPGAGAFWRAVAAQCWGEAWAETVEPVPGRPDVPPDHWIRTV